MGNSQRDSDSDHEEHQSGLGGRFVRRTRGRRRSDLSLLPPCVKYAWAVLVTVLVFGSAALGDGSKHARTLDRLIQTLTGIPYPPAGTTDTTR